MGLFPDKQGNSTEYMYSRGQYNVNAKSGMVLLRYRSGTATVLLQYGRGTVWFGSGRDCHLLHAYVHV